MNSVYEASRYPKHDAVVHRRKATKAFARFVTDLEALVCDSSPENEAAVLGNRQCRELIQNNGRATFAVHSTSVERACTIMQSGLASAGMRDISKGFDRSVNPCSPRFGRTLVLLGGPKEKDQTRFNTHALAYEYQSGTGNVAKAVFAFPVPHDGKPYYTGFDINKTFLGTADGVMVTEEIDDNSVVDTFRIAPSFSLGYFNLATREFVYNEQFHANA